MNDEELIARAREAGAELRRRPGDLDRLAGWLLKELAGRLGGRAAAQAITMTELPGPVRDVISEHERWAFGSVSSSPHDDEFERDLTAAIAHLLGAAQATEDSYRPHELPHAYDADSHVHGRPCTLCGEGPDNPVHRI